MCNTRMNDAELIAHLGGPAKVAALLNLEGDFGVQRVFNWISRGIPPGVKLERPDLFLPGWAPAPAQTPTTEN